ncbi:MAG: hypothetical protein HVN35_07425 [Methanobacteriaceae archaeon]|nr:hypothetical protein [Methanobacteriaceae archaeon]
MKNYIENNKQLPTIVNIYGHNIIMPTFLELLTTTVLQINKNDLITPINSKSYGNAPLPRDTMNTGNIPKNEYISIAQNVKNFMDSQLKAPEYAYSTSIGLYFSYQNMIYTYSKILDAYNSTGSLPSNVAVGPWMVTVSQVVEAAVQVKTYIDTNHQLPSSITINGFVVSMPTFLKLLTTSVIQIKNKDLNTLINPLNYGVPFSPRDSMIKGDMLKTEYIFIAQNVNKFMEDNGKAPEYAYDTSLGLYFGYQNMIYTFSQILNTYSTSRELPNNVSINPWMVSVGQVVNAAVQVKTYIDTYRELPSSATVNGIMMSMPTFLQLLTTSVIQINKNDVTTLLNYQSYGYPSQPRDQLKNRDMYKVEYISIAQNVKNFMDSQMKAPEYAIARL